jgi:hypothetical protein
MNGGTIRTLLRHRPPGWWIAPLYLVMSIAMVPWIGVLMVSLPDRVVSHNYRLAWVGFDVLLVAAMVRTAWLAARRSPFVVNVASATATLLVVDAWFDVTTAPRREMFQSFTLAVLVELPAAVLSLVIAGRAQVVIARTGAVRGPHERWLLMRPLRPPVAGALPVAVTGPADAPANGAGSTVPAADPFVGPAGSGVTVPDADR